MEERKTEAKDTKTVPHRAGAQILDSIAILFIASVPIAVIATTFAFLEPTGEVAS